MVTIRPYIVLKSSFIKFNYFKILINEGQKREHMLLN